MQRTVWTRSLRTAIVVCHKAEVVHLNYYDVGVGGGDCGGGDEDEVHLIF